MKEIPGSDPTDSDFLRQDCSVMGSILHIKIMKGKEGKIGNVKGLPS